MCNRRGKGILLISFSYIKVPFFAYFSFEPLRNYVRIGLLATATPRRPKTSDEENESEMISIRLSELGLIKKRMSIAFSLWVS